MNYLSVFILLFSSLACSGQKIITGADQTDKYISLLANKRVGVIVNQTSMIHNTHLVDSLKKSGINISTIFAPEHGFRGKADAGEVITNGMDTRTGIPIVSLYGDNKKPKPTQLANLDVLLFDIQDVGVRFYTFISTLQYIMEAASENNVPLIILDRPNPNGYYVAGPVLDTAYKSFIGMHPIPVVHGLTIGELAKMIVGEQWISKPIQLTIISCDNYTHSSRYSLPIKPSPNLPNDVAVQCYPSLGLFEGTEVSVGRGTSLPFQIAGTPKDSSWTYSFTPMPTEGAKDPFQKGKKCYGINFSSNPIQGFKLEYIIQFYSRSTNKESFFQFEPFFNKLIGNSWVVQRIKAGNSAKDIENEWLDQLSAYKAMRKKYLLYPDFE